MAHGLSRDTYRILIPLLLGAVRALASRAGANYRHNNNPFLAEVLA